jgi:hypothetical protein
MHPDREVLWEINGALSDLSKFEKSEKFRPILRGPIDLLRGELNTAHQYLWRREHTVAWVGDIGVGKTTALAHTIGLLVGGGRSPKRPAFPTGSGRTTICETAVRVAPTFGISVDPVEDDEIIKLTRDLVAALAGATGVGVPTEINRALRNMAGMRTRRVQKTEDEFEVLDPIADLLKEGLAVDEAVDRVVSAMRLTERRERQLVLPEGSLDGLVWLSNLISKINHGQEDRFSLPDRITVLMPSESLSKAGQILSIIDTRGLEGTTQRHDLIGHRDDARTLVVLCAKFADAPGQSVTRFLEETKSSGSDALERGRLCLLVLPRGEEALQLPGLEEPISSRAEGYAVRRQDIRQALAKSDASELPVYFFDALADDAKKVWEQLRLQVSDMRRNFARRAGSAVKGVANLIANVDLVKTGEARRRIEEATDRVFKFVEKLPPTARAPYLNLIDQLDVAHPSSVAASIVRGGDWDNFDIASILGSGVRIDANKRIASHFARIDHKLDEFAAEHAELQDVVQSIDVLRSLIAEGRQEFLATAHAIGRDAYGTLIAKEKDVWLKSEARYGGGSGYKNDVASYWREFFESGSDDQARTKRAVDGRLQKAWEQTVLDRLRVGTRAETDQA